MTKKPKAARGLEAIIAEKAELLGKSDLLDAVQEELRRLAAAEIAEQIRSGDVKLPGDTMGWAALGMALEAAEGELFDGEEAELE